MSNLLLICNLCYGSIRPSCLASCEKPYQVLDNIVKLSDQFSDILVVNTYYNQSDRKHINMPPYFVPDTQDTLRLNEYEQKIAKLNFEVCNKYTLSCLGQPHILTRVKNKYTDITVCGFSLSLDILPTCIDLISLDKKVTLKCDCVGNLPDQPNEILLKYLGFLGVKII